MQFFKKKEKAKILVVEDNPTTRRVLNERLTSNQFQVIEAGDGVQGLALANRERPDLILLDIILPGLDGVKTADGLKVFELFRKETLLTGTPIIFLTGLAAGTGLVKSGNPRREYWTMGKPYRPEELLEAIDQALLYPWKEGE